MPTVQVLKLREMGTDTVIPIRRSAQLGRSPDLTWAADRPIPIHHGLLELAIQIDGTADRVSRNHCAIYRHGNGEFFAVDLRSRNGTTLNHAQLEPGKLYPLRAGNRLLLGNAVGFEVASIEDIIVNNYALLVGHSGGNLEDIKNNTSIIAHELHSRGFAGNIETLIDKQATPKSVVQAIERIAEKATPDSHTLFYYAGHGSASLGGIFGGLVLGNWFTGMYSYLSPVELHGALGKVEGKKAAIIDACFSGAFIDGASPDTLVITAAPAYWISVQTKERRFGRRQWMGVLTEHLVQYFRDHPHTFNLAGLQEKFEHGIPIDHYLIRRVYPQVNDVTRFTIVAAAPLRDGSSYRRR